jgi:hypothetical protein
MFNQAVGAMCEVSPDAQSLLGACGTCETAFELMGAHQTDRAVMGSAMGVLRFLSEGHPANSVLLSQLGAFEVIARELTQPGVEEMGRVTGLRALQQIGQYVGESGVLTPEEYDAAMAGVSRRLGIPAEWEEEDGEAEGEEET